MVKFIIVIINTSLYFYPFCTSGTDRFHNQYWSFAGDERLFVQQREEVPERERTGEWRWLILLTNLNISVLMAVSN